MMTNEPETRPALTPEQFAERMGEIAKIAERDEEAAHVQADYLLCDLLDALGYHEGVTVFEDMPKWYA